MLMFGAFAGIFLLKNTTVFKIGADSESQPKNIRVSNITDTSATVSWTTDKETSNYLVWGTSSGSITKIVDEDAQNGKYFNHTVTVSGLSPKTTYFYKINSDGVIYDNSNAPWQFTTGITINSGTNSRIVSGNVINASGNPIKRALVYIDINGYLLSTQTSDTGNFVFQLGSARTADLLSNTEIDPAQTLMQLSVQSFPDGVASAQIYLQSANPLPPIIIGQTYDFRNEPVNNFGTNPNATLNLPEDVDRQSKFDITVPSNTPKPTSVILESITEGEIITSTQPQFFGKGPGGVEIKITVHSEEEIIGNVQIPKSGSWSFAVPKNLSPGKHTITISWVDISGITRFLTRDFVVQAGEVPAFTASQSGSTPTPTPSRTPTATPTRTATAAASVSPTTSATPTRTPTLRPSGTPTIEPSASPTVYPVPVTGDLTPTLLLFIMGMIVMTFSFVVWKISEN